MCICIYYTEYIHLYIPIIRHFRNSCWPPKYSCMSCILGSKVKGCDQRFVFQGGEGSWDELRVLKLRMPGNGWNFYTLTSEISCFGWDIVWYSLVLHPPLTCFLKTVTYTFCSCGFRRHPYDFWWPAARRLVTGRRTCEQALDTFLFRSLTWQLTCISITGMCSWRKACGCVRKWRWFHMFSQAHFHWPQPE